MRELLHKQFNNWKNKPNIYVHLPNMAALDESVQKRCHLCTLLRHEMQLGKKNQPEESSTPDEISRVYMYPSEDHTSTFLNVRCEGDWGALLLEDLPG